MSEQPRPEAKVIPDSKVGFSLSLCVSDILAGKVKEEEVKEIIAATNAPTSQKMDEVIAGYKRTYWHNDPEEGEAIAAGKISQPRTEGMEAHNISEGHWVDAEKAGEEYRKKVRLALA